MLQYPLTLSTVIAEFPELSLGRDSVEIFGKPRGIEGAVDGAWPFARLRRFFADKGYQYIKEPHGARFVNTDQTVGVVCVGQEPNPKTNGWKTYSFELQARTLKQTQAGVGSSRANLAGL